MILDKVPLPDDPTFPDAPPSYENVTGSAATAGARGPSDAKHPQGPQPGPSTLPPPSSFQERLQSVARAKSKDKGKGRAAPPSSGWFPFGLSRSGREVRDTVLGLVRGLVQQPCDGATASILDSCEEACATQGLSFSALLQEPSIEEHTPIYWAIVKRPRRSNDVDEPQDDLLIALLSRSAPLNSATVADIRLACAVTSDNDLFQNLRRSPGFWPTAGVDRLLLSGDGQADNVIVEDAGNEQGAFVAHLTIPLFQQRMRVSRLIEVELIARGERAWGMRDRQIKPGTWLVSVALLPHSPPTWLDSRLVIEDYAYSHPRPTSPDTSSPSSPSASSRSAPLSPAPSVSRTNKPKGKPKPSISLRIKPSASGQLAPPELCDHHNFRNEVIVPFDESLMASSLQYE
ncbi:hypothetical protein PUNSTDRAFT_72792 [Punctularia strigosozonata HHB-11173 SS5]|uniref:uncharacterized protein n=1 Tax=Punctularia strigosozonata (strain HHB-11173) TaxID=741275 RepID=UPI0004416D6F|nr:uncharacterized protein PUNSTDRAFT_72792 [Punctularia strigosozonata HHB-11173 SS5]EIN06382.1 hypothetical protein PUNSTDRAFT_72792 [Punctularia strigosozonata HHB-11173 SS5]